MIPSWPGGMRTGVVAVALLATGAIGSAALAQDSQVDLLSLIHI